MDSLYEHMKDTAEEDPFVEEHLKHAVALENGYVTFDAKIEGRVNCSKWYKNGEEILRNPRFRVRVRRCWHRLKIRNLRKSDIGVYTLICQNDENYVTSQATLHVLPEKRLGVPRPKNCTALFLSWRKSFAITRHLKNVRIKKGDPIVLKVEICKPKNVNLVFSWYKNHRSCSPLTNDGTEIICKENKSAEYVQYNSEFQDSGIYTVVISTEGIMLSSTAEVVIMEPDCLQDKGFPAVDNPYFTQSLPDELDVFETEEVTMLCKTVLLPCNEVIFYKDGNVLEENDNVTFGYYENRGLKIHIKRASVRDCGFYSIIMRNEYSKRFAYTKCLLRVNSAPSERIPEVQLVRPLTNAISSIGSRMCFYCRFYLPENCLFYVVWRIGFYQVERDTPQFKLTNTDTGFYSIFIRRLDPDMVGEVSCQLRCMIPSKRSIQVVITKSYLVHVPPEALEGDYLEDCKILTMDMDFNRTTAIITAPYADAGREVEEGRQDEAAALVETSEQEYLSSPGSSPSQTKGLSRDLGAPPSIRLMKILYYRLPDDFAHFVGFDYHELKPVMVSAGLNDDKDVVKTSKEVIEIEWLEGREPRFNSWYAVDLKQASGDYEWVGNSSFSKIVIRDPQPGRLISLRTRLIDGMEVAATQKLSISGLSTGEIGWPGLAPISPMKEFNENYMKIGEPLGIGAYGAVYLVRDRNGCFLAAKAVKTWTEKRRAATRREIEILQRLDHKRIVRLHASYFSREQMIIIMDYLWGGELFERIVEEENFKERIAVHYIQQICEGLEYLHAQNIVHLDIKPENVVCTSRNSRDIKIVDFGLSRVLGNGQIRAIYGTRDYIAPEVLSYESIETASDMWSLGVVTYVMLSGILPFNGTTWVERAAAITMGQYDFSDPAFDTITTDAKRFIQSLLTLHPLERLTACSAQQHTWMQADSLEDFGVGQTQRWRSNMRTYLETNKAIWQRAGNVVIAANRLAGNRLTGAHRESHARLAT